MTVEDMFFLQLFALLLNNFLYIYVTTKLNKKNVYMTINYFDLTLINDFGITIVSIVFSDFIDIFIVFRLNY